MFEFLKLYNKNKGIHLVKEIHISKHAFIYHQCYGIIKFSLSITHNDILTLKVSIVASKYKVIAHMKNCAMFMNLCKNHYIYPVKN